MSSHLDLQAEAQRLARAAMALSSADGTITFTPLLGVGEHDPLAYLLDIDGFRILLDCGWSTDFDPQEIEPLTKCV
jgi:hypothetical protein